MFVFVRLVDGELCLALAPEECFVRSNAYAMGIWHDAFVFLFGVRVFARTEGHVFKRAAMMRLVVTHTGEFKENCHACANRKNSSE